MMNLKVSFVNIKQNINFIRKYFLLNKITCFCCFFVSTGLLATTISLDFRVTALEENGGGDGNSSVADLEVRVETLEGTAADHETRISAAEIDINGR